MLCKSSNHLRPSVVPKSLRCLRVLRALRGSKRKPTLPFAFFAASREKIHVLPANRRSSARIDSCRTSASHNWMLIVCLLTDARSYGRTDALTYGLPFFLHKILRRTVAGKNIIKMKNQGLNSKNSQQRHLSRPYIRGSNITSSKEKK